MTSNNIKNTPRNNYDSDYKAEVIAAEMIENGFSAEQVIILMLGPLKRPYSKDVDTIANEISDYDHKEYMVVKTPKEGLYDMLPEGLFHLPNSHKSAKTEKEIIDSIKKRREEERNARRFFLPFEATISHLSVQMALYESTIDKRSHYDELIKLFSPHWKIFQYLDARQANIFIHILPIIHEIRDEHRIIETIIELIFLLPVQVTVRRQLSLKMDKFIKSDLTDIRLGVNFTTGSSVYDDGDDEIVINIGPMNSRQLQEFMPEGTGSKILELLCDYLLPVNIDVVTELILNEEDKMIKLYDEENKLNCTLGMNTFL